MFVPSHQFIHVHIPKCGGTSIRQVIEGLGLEEWVPEGLHKGKVWHWTARGWRRRLGRQRYEAQFSFAVIRHPGSHLLSRYHYHRDVLRPPNPHLIPKHVSFVQWMREFVAHAPLGDIAELENLSRYLVDREGEIIVDEVIKLDELDAKWLQLREKMKLPRTAVLSHANTTNHGDWREIYAEHPDLKPIVEARFGDDFNRFGWTWE